MADSKISQLTSLAAAPADGDLIPIVDVSDTTMAASGTNKKLAAVYVARSDGSHKLITGSARELTVPATGTAALLATSQTFTSLQTISNPTTNVQGLIVNAPASVSVPVMLIKYNGTTAISLNVRADDTSISTAALDTGTGVGTYLYLERNNNASTPAAGALAMVDKGNTAYWVWPDDSGNLRIYTGLPTNANDGAGTVVGAQTSSLDSKDIVGDPIPIDEILAAVQAGAEAVRRFVYKSGSFNGEEFSGIVTDYAPRYGMDRDAEHPAGKSLNEITVIGDLLMAVANLAARVKALESKS